MANVLRYKYAEWASGDVVLLDKDFPEDDERHIVIRCDSLADDEVERIRDIATALHAEGT